MFGGGLELELSVNESEFCSGKPSKVASSSDGVLWGGLAISFIFLFKYLKA